MHHKRIKRTTRHESKRQENKSYRQAVRRTLEGAPPAAGRGYRYATPASIRSVTLPLGDRPSTGKARAKIKQRKPKDRCSVNRTHEWYKEEVVETHRYDMPGFVRWNAMHTEAQRVTRVRTYRIATCIHCWKVKQIGRGKTTYEQSPLPTPSKQRYGPRPGW
jgi:hypothetical protein